MKHIILCSLFLVALTGCCHAPQKPCVPTTIEVKVPVPVPAPQPPVVERPSLVIHQLNEADKTDPGKVAQYYEATVQQLLGYSKSLETILDSYRTKKDSTK